MTTETEKLKKRLEYMNQELALRRRKLKKHTRKKDLKLTQRKRHTQNIFDGTSEITEEYPSILETSVVQANKCNDNFVGNSREYCLPSLSAVHDNSQGGNDCVQCTEEDDHIVRTASFSNYNNLSVFEDKNAPPKLTDVSNMELAPTVVRSSSTPKKLVTNEDKSDLSPILMQRTLATKSYVNHQTKLLPRKMKGLASSCHSRRKDYVKQIPVILSHDMLCKVRSCLNVNHATSTSGLENSTDTSSMQDDTLPVQNMANNPQREVKSSLNVDPLNITSDTQDKMLPVQNNETRNITATFTSRMVQLSQKEGPVLAAFCEGYFLCLVQELLISLWNFVESSWLHTGSLPRQHISCGTSVGCKGISINGEEMFVCVELWAVQCSEEAALTSATYRYNSNYRCSCVELKHVQGYVKNIQFCILPELSLVISWVNCNAASSTTVVKFSLDNESGVVLKSTELTAVKEKLNSLHFVKSCTAVVLGESASYIYLWEHCTGALLRAIWCPRNDAIVRWADEDQGFLFAAVATQTHVELIAINLTTAKWKQVRRFLLPETYRLRGVGVDFGKMMVVFLEGIMCWELKSGLLLTERQNTHKNIETFHGRRHAVNVRPNYAVEVVRVSMST